jgi:uncharacterized membrane protein
METDSLIAGTTRAIELVGIAVLLVGGLLASGRFVREWLTDGLDGAYQRYRANLGRAILLGLEILIIADIIGTIAVEPTLHNLAILAVIVLVRTFLSFALEIEISGDLPWRRSTGDAPHQPPQARADEKVG